MNAFASQPLLAASTVPGTVATTWFENQEMGIYKNGDKIGALNNTHGVENGRAIPDNANYVFVSIGNSFGR